MYTHTGQIQQDINPQQFAPGPQPRNNFSSLPLPPAGSRVINKGPIQSTSVGSTATKPCCNCSALPQGQKWSILEATKWSWWPKPSWNFSVTSETIISLCLRGLVCSLQPSVLERIRWHLKFASLLKNQQKKKRVTWFARNDNAFFFFYTILNYENSVSTEWAWIRAQLTGKCKHPKHLHYTATVPKVFCNSLEELL